MAKVNLTEPIEVGRNKFYVFAVGLLEGRWVGFAQANEGIFIFPQISENHHLGLTDRTKVILLTGAIAQDPEAAYGGIKKWAVEPALRGKPAKFRCERCLIVGCLGSCKDDY